MESSTAEQIVDMHHYRINKDQSFDDLVLRNSIGLDSGYSSTGNLTCNSDASSNITSFRSSLEPISEDVELKSFNVTPMLTPVSKNAQMIDAFHITTPGNASSSSPIKFGADRSRRYCEYTPNKLNERKNIYATPTKKSSLKRRHDSFRHKLSRENSFDLQFNEDIENASFIDKMPLSPLNCSKANSSILLENHRQFERKLSENSLQSSTPISYQVAPKLNTIAVPKLKFSPKPNIFRKAASFSPMKYFQQQQYETKRSENVVLELPNPAKQLLDFSPQMFDKLLHEKHHLHAAVKPLATPPAIPSLPHREELEKSDQATSQRKDHSHDLIPTSLSFDQTIDTSSCQNVNIEASSSASNDILTELPKINKSKRKLVEPTTPHKNQCPVPTITPYSEQTPKRIRRSTSLNTDPIKEKNLILYSHLPCTPPKNRRRLIKRLAACTKKCEASPAKRKLYETPSRTVPQKQFSYDGMERLDILRHLAETRPAIELIFGYLSGNDLANVCMVSRIWSRIVTLNSKANNRRKKFLRQQTSNNENVADVCFRNAIIHNTSAKNRVPFSVCNGMIARNTLSEDELVLTPSKRRFYENQKIIEKCEKHAKFRKCPRCGRSSVIHSAQKPIDNEIQSQSPPSIPARSRPPKLMKLRATKSVDANLFPFQKQHSFSFDFDCDITRPSEHSHNVDASGVDDNGDDDDNKYATCTGPNCSYKFCLKCLCDYTINHCCFLSTSSSTHLDSFSRQSIGNGPVSCTKHSKRNLRRLCSIDKM